MPNPLQQALGSLATTVKAFAGETVTYRRGTSSFQIVAVPGRGRRGVVSDDALSMATDDLDFIVERSELAFNGVLTLPMRGDEIVRTVGSETLTYAVRVDGTIDRYDTDAARQTLRIRTKLKGKA